MAPAAPSYPDTCRCGKSEKINHSLGVLSSYEFAGSYCTAIDLASGFYGGLGKVKQWRPAEKYDGSEPVNLGSGEEIAMRDLAKLIAAEVPFTDERVWDTTQPNGQPRRCLDTTKAKRFFGFEAKCRLRERIARTVTWYLLCREREAIRAG